MKHAVTLGESMALFRPKEIGRLETKSETRLGFGGAESNVAIGLARFGIETTWISRVGAEPLGRLVRNGIRGQGVHLHIEEDSQHQTGIMVKEETREGLAKVFYYRANSAASHMNSSLVTSFDWSGSSLFHSSGITQAISESASEAVGTAIKLAKAAGALCSFDVNYRSKLISGDQARKKILGILSDVDYLFGSEAEISMLNPDSKDALSAALGIAEQFNCVVILKRGENGAAAVADGKVIEHRGMKVTPVDPVGAGDAFVAGFLATLLSDGSLEKCLQVGHEFGALSVLAPGDWESQPEPNELFTNSEDVSR